MLQEKFPQAYTEFQPLEEIVVGRGYSTTIIDKFANSMSSVTKRLLTYLLDETEEDYQNLIKVLETYGAKVYRPKYSGKIINHLEVPYLMNPRDSQIVLDKYIIFANSGNATTKDFAKPLSNYAKFFIRDKSIFDLSCASIIRLGKDIIIDSNKNANTEESYKYIKNLLEPIGYNVLYTKTHNFKFQADGCHADSCFAILKPGVLLTLKPEYMYTDGLFPKWDTCRLEGESWTKMQSWLKFKKNSKNFSYCFDNEKYNDKEFHNYINTWLSNWVGYAKETVFDVNCLSLDENTVCVSGYNKKVFDYFKKHKIEPIIIPWRHRYFWDGGLHCITLDIKRKGNAEVYL